MALSSIQLIKPIFPGKMTKRDKRPSLTYVSWHESVQGQRLYFKSNIWQEQNLVIEKDCMHVQFRLGIRPIKNRLYKRSNFKWSNLFVDIKIENYSNKFKVIFFCESLHLITCVNNIQVCLRRPNCKEDTLWKCCYQYVLFRLFAYLQCLDYN